MSDPAPLASAQAADRPPRTYLGWGLMATVLCFLPLGLITLYYGLRTARAGTDGRLEDAVHDSHVARRWLVATVVVGVLVYLMIGATFVLLGAFST